MPSNSNLRRFNPTQAGRRLLALLFIGIVLVTLAAGLWPFSRPSNDATWLAEGSGIAFHRHGVAVGNTPLNIDASALRGCTLEVWLHPDKVWTTGVPVAVYSRRDARSFELTQDYTDLLLRLETTTHHGTRLASELRVPDVLRRRDFLLSLVADGQRTSVYVDGKLLTTSQSFMLAPNDLSGELILGNAPLRNRAWAGQIKGLDIYGRALSSSEVASNADRWTSGTGLIVSDSAQLLALYSFRQRSGNLIRNEAGDAGTLQLPAKFVTEDEMLFENPVSEARADGNYIGDALVNVAGFVPLGFMGALAFGILRDSKRAILLALLAGFLTSLAIEYFQWYLPTRFSGTTDLITNSIGTLLGALFCLLLMRLAEKVRPDTSAPGPSI